MLSTYLFNLYAKYIMKNDGLKGINKKDFGYMTFTNKGYIRNLLLKGKEEIILRDKENSGQIGREETDVQ